MFHTSVNAWENTRFTEHVLTKLKTSSSATHVEFVEELVFLNGAEGRELLRVAVQRGIVDPNLDMKRKKSGGGGYLIHAAAAQNDVALLRALVGKGARVSGAVNDMGMDALRWAIRHGSEDAALYLMSEGGATWKAPADNSLLAFAAAAGRLRVVKYVLARMREEQWAGTMRMELDLAAAQAVEKGRYAVVKLFQEEGLDLMEALDHLCGDDKLKAALEATAKMASSSAEEVADSEAQAPTAAAAAEAQPPKNRADRRREKKMQEKARKREAAAVGGARR